MTFRKCAALWGGHAVVGLRSTSRAAWLLALAALLFAAPLPGAAQASPRPQAPTCSCGPACRCAACAPGGCGCTVQRTAPQALAAPAHHEFLPPELPGLQEIPSSAPSRRARSAGRGLLPSAHRDRLLRPPRLPVAS